MSVSVEALVQASGGISQQDALKALENKYPGADIRFALGRFSQPDGTVSGRSPRTERGGWRAGVETQSSAFEAIVSPKGRVMRDPMGQSDL